MNAPAYSALPTIAPSAPSATRAAIAQRSLRPPHPAAGDHRTDGRRAYLAKQVEVRAAERAIAAHVRNDVASTPVGVESGQYVGQLATLPGANSARITWCRGRRARPRAFRRAMRSPTAPSRAVPGLRSRCLTRAQPVASVAARSGDRYQRLAPGIPITFSSTRRLDLDLGRGRRLVRYLSCL